MQTIKIRKYFILSTFTFVWIIFDISLQRLQKKFFPDHWLNYCLSKLDVNWIENWRLTFEFKTQHEI